jgi:hypothetical protein
MPETTLQRAHDRLRAKLKIDPPLPAKLTATDDEVLGTLVRVESRTAVNDKGEESHYDVAVLGDASLDGLTTIPKGWDGGQLVEVSLSGSILKRKWDELAPRPGEVVGIRRLWETRTRAGRDAVDYNVVVDRDGDIGGDVPSPTEPLSDDDGYDE